MAAKKIGFLALVTIWLASSAALKVKDYKDKMEKYILGYKLIEHLEPKHTYVHWEAPEQFPPIVLPARVVSSHLRPGLGHPAVLPAVHIHRETLAHVVQQPVLRPAPNPGAVMQVMLPPQPQPQPQRQPLVHIDRQDKGHIVVQGMAGGKVKCPYEVYRIRQL